ncbi:MAG: archaellin/type IV pilin N-terminal domain-containing protein [Candidatus Bathyarchaeia archaeon]
MKTKTLLKSRKGISPILATLLLIVIAVAAIVVTYAWIMVYMRSAGQQAGIQLNIEAVNWPTNSTIKLYVRNTGTSDATIDAVYVGTSSENLVKQNDVTFNPANKVVTANGGTIEITINYQWTPQTTYYFKVAPSTGPAAEGSTKAPTSS